ncbi:MAG: hypothetical protein AABW56_04825, partial [Nanoarchaeota archaeon]
MLLLSGMGNTLLGDDGFLTHQLAETTSSLKNLGLKPFISTYAPQNIGLQSYSAQDLKDSDYCFNEDCSLLNFYDYLNKMKGE